MPNLRASGRSWSYLCCLRLQDHANKRRCTMSTSHHHQFGGEGGHFVLPEPIRLKSFGDDPWSVAGRNLLNLHLKPGPILSWSPGKDYGRALEQFKRDLIAKQVRDRLKKHRTALLMLPE